MFQVKRTGDHRVDVTFSGKIDADGMQVMLDELMNASTGFEHGRMLYRIEQFDLPTLGALVIELSRVAQLFILIRRFDRCAVIADQAWVRTASQIEGALIPGLQIKAFAPDQTALAEAWMNQA